MNQDYKRGLKLGLPICLGYIPVSFAFGMMAVSGGIDVYSTILISFTNLTSAGQFAGTNLIIQCAAYLEIALTTLVINLRYSVMSLALSQKLKTPMTVLKRMVMAIGITDETFALSMVQKGDISFSLWMGLITLPYIGWTLGTALGAVATTLLPAAVQQCLTIALYAMFVAIVIPASKDSAKIAKIVGITAVLSTVFYALHVSSGFSIIIVSVVCAALGAKLYPHSEGGDTV